MTYYWYRHAKSPIKFWVNQTQRPIVIGVHDDGRCMWCDYETGEIYPKIGGINTPTGADILRHTPIMLPFVVDEGQ